jgi:hypothetical protein
MAAKAAIHALTGSEKTSLETVWKRKKALLF